MKERTPFDNISPIDYRYWDEEVAQYLSEEGFVRYKLRVELALVKQLCREGICSEKVVQEVKSACEKITAVEVYAEEEKIHHDVRALVNCIRARVSEESKPYIHMLATSYDIVDTANAARYRDVVLNVLCPALKKLEKVLIDITLREAETVQIGRTHGQHAIPITFGFAMAGYVSRLGNCILALEKKAKDLRGKFSGAVGGYNASLLFFEYPEAFEIGVLVQLDLVAAEYSTQIIPPEPMSRLFCEIALASGIIANLSDDMRHLQRTEIGEIGEEFSEKQVGSSTMPQKRNPINFENAKSFWKIVMPKIVTVFMDQISEHQRDLTNSASSRTYGEIIAYVVSSAKRISKAMQKLRVDENNFERNFFASGDMFLAEPLYILLSKAGFPDAHEKLRLLSLRAQEKNILLTEIFVKDHDLVSYIEKFPQEWQELLKKKSWEIKKISVKKIYTGIASEKARKIAKRWKRRFKF
ncbi:MAG: lyase family protein [Patescibacteria group bacterium]